MKKSNNKSGYLTSLITVYILLSITNIYHIITIFFHSGSVYKFENIVVRALWLVVFWGTIYSLGKRKRNGYWIVIGVELTRSVYSIVLVFAQGFTSILLLPDFARYVLEIQIIAQIIILPAVLILLAYKGKRYLVN